MKALLSGAAAAAALGLLAGVGLNPHLDQAAIGDDQQMLAAADTQTADASDGSAAPPYAGNGGAETVPVASPAVALPSPTTADLSFSAQPSGTRLKPTAAVADRSEAVALWRDDDEMQAPSDDEPDAAEDAPQWQDRWRPPPSAEPPPGWRPRWAAARPPPGWAYGDGDADEDAPPGPPAAWPR